MSQPDPRAFLESLFSAAVDAVKPEKCLTGFIPAKPKGRTIVIGAGKASAEMARAFEMLWDGPLEGLVVTRYGHGAACEQIEIVEAAHPVPDEAGTNAALRMLTLMDGLTGDDLVVALISGGGSALLCAPAPGIDMETKRDINRALLASGASIHEMNCVRKHLSAIKGGRLAVRAHPARMVTLCISDVPGDDISTVASGPTVPDATTLAQARDIVARYRIDVPAAASAYLADEKNETPKPGNPAFGGDEAHLVASASRALAAAAMVARDAGYACLVLGDGIEGESREIAKMHAAIACYAAATGEPVKRPALILSGGETTVTVRGKGRGGRNAEFGLSLAIALDSAKGIHAIACDTDGIDGTEDNAGVYVAPDTLSRLFAAGVTPLKSLDNNDGYSAFAALDALIITGPTLTNVNDFRAILIE